MPRHSERLQGRSHLKCETPATQINVVETEAIIRAIRPRGHRISQDNAMIVRRFADEVITQGDIDAAARYVCEDVVNKSPSLAKDQD